MVEVRGGGEAGAESLGVSSATWRTTWYHTHDFTVSRWWQKEGGDRGKTGNRGDMMDKGNR